MANKTLNTQILLRNDTLANWQASTRVLGKGEAAVVFVPDAETAGYSVKVKYGDGVHTFNDLPYSGIDVKDIPLASATVDGLLSKADFAKLAAIASGAQVNIIESVEVNGTAATIEGKTVKITVPTGTLASKDKVSENDLEDALKEKVNAASEGNHAHLNKTVLDGITAEKVSAWDAAQPNVIESIKVNGAARPITDKAVDISVPTGALASKDKVAESDLETALATKINGKANSSLIGSIPTGATATTVIGYIDMKAVEAEYDDTALAGRVTAVEGLVGKTAVSTQISTAISNLDLPNTYDKKGAADTALASAKTYADGKDAAIAAAKKAGDDAQADVDTLAGKVGTVPAGKTVVQMIEDAQAGATYDDTQVKADIAANTQTIATLNGTGAGSVKKAVDDGINDFATKISDDNVVNTFKELVDYVAAHGSEAATMTANIRANADAIDALEALVGSKAVATQITEAITAALKVDGVDKYALATDLAAAVTRVGSAESAITAIQTKLATIAEGATKVEASTTNGNIKINGQEKTVYTLPTEVVLSTDTLILDGGNA